MSTQQTDRIGSPLASLAIKAPCRAATAGADITLSGLQTVDGVALIAGDRVLVKDQTAAMENGIYLASTSSWQRTTDFDGTNDAVNGTTVIVGSEGTANGATFWQVTSADPITIDTSDIIFKLLPVMVSYDDTSASSVTIGTGAKSFTVSAGKQFSAGQILIASDQADPSNFMVGSVTSYSGTTLELDVTDIGGSGTFAAWNISLSGPPGQIGPQGPTGATGGSGIPWAIGAGTADALTATFSPTTPTLNSGEDGYIWRMRVIGANTVTGPTFAPDSQGPYTIKKAGATALVAGDIPAAGFDALLSFNYNGGSSYVELLNPAPSAGLPSIADGDILANISGASAQAIANTLTAILDHVFGSTRGMILVRDASAWVAKALGTNNQALYSNGSDPVWVSNPNNFAVRGDNVSEFANDAGYITSASTTYGAVGTYTVHSWDGSTTLGGTTALSGLSGTWRNMGTVAINTCLPCVPSRSLYVRIS